MRILVSGSLAYDRILNFDGEFKDVIIPEKIASLNVSFFSPTMTESFGGCAGNMSYSLALLGETPILLVRVGRDFTAYQTWLESQHISTDTIERSVTEPTATAIMVTDKKGNQISIYTPSASNTAYTYGTLTADFCIVGPGNPDDMRALPTLCKTQSIPYLFDPGQQIPTLSGDDLKNGMTGAKVVISNDYELSMIMQRSGWTEAEILSHADILVTTLGEKGSVVKTKNEQFEIPPAKPLNTNDPTGAGDAYRTGFVHALLKGWSLDVAGRLGGLVAAYTVETKGTQTHTFTNQELRVRYKENFNQELPN